DGYVRATDRKKDLSKPAGGKYVAPQEIEVIFKAVSLYASQIVVHGDTRNYCTALITLDPEAIRDWATRNGMGGLSYEELTRSEAVHELIQGEADQLNARLELWETIKKFQILSTDLSVETGHLTPSLKLNREVTE